MGSDARLPAVLALCVWEERIPNLLDASTTVVWRWRAGSKQGSAESREQAEGAVLAAAMRAKERREKL